MHAQVLQGERIVGLLVDVQGGGSGAGKTAWSLVSLGAQLASEGAGPEAIAGLLNRALWTRRGGRVQAGIGVLVWENDHRMTTATYGSVLVISVNADMSDPSTSDLPAGLRREAGPATYEHGETDGPFVMCSDGIAASGEDLRLLIERVAGNVLTAEVVLNMAVSRDQGRPRNDMSVIVTSAQDDVSSRPSTAGEIRVARRRNDSVREVLSGRSSDG